MTLKVPTHSKYDVIHALDCLCLNNGYGCSHVFQIFPVLWLLPQKTHADQIKHSYAKILKYTQVLSFKNRNQQ